jgi:hypothetical protein
LYVSLRGLGRMSAIGTKRTFASAPHMSAFEVKADIGMSPTAPSAVAGTASGMGHSSSLTHSIRR